MKQLSGIYILLLAAVFCACSEEAVDEPDMPDFIRIESGLTSLTAPPEGGPVKIRFSTNSDWEATATFGNGSLPGELLSYSGGKGECELLFTATPNTGSGSRTSLISITAGRASAEISIVQNAIEVTLPDEAEVREYLVRLYEENDGPNWRFREKWCSDLPINEWGSQIKYENGRLELILSENNLTGSINLSGCKALTSIRCSKNRITSLDVSDCPLLTHVDCTNTGLEHADFSGCLSLREVSAGYNNLSRLDLGWCSTLTQLRVPYCNLEELNLDNCVLIESVQCNNNRLTRLEIPWRRHLQDVFCYENRIITLDVSDSPLLKILNCGDNDIDNLNVGGSPYLRWIFCYNNRLTALDTSDQKTSLTCFYCYSNRLSSLDVSGYYNLSELHCSDNDIDSIDIKGCRNLRWLYCSHNKLEELDFSGVEPTSLERIDVSHNRLRRADLTGFPYLMRLWCAGNLIGGEIPEHFSRLAEFEYDVRYDYSPSTGTYVDRGYGWWYPGEPEKMSHTK